MASGLGTPARSTRLPALRALITLCVALWGLECVWWLAHAETPSVHQLSGLALALGRGLLPWLGLGLLLEGARAVAAPQKDALPLRPIGQFLWAHEPERQALRVAALLAGLLLLVVYAGLGFWITRRIIIGMVRPHFAALTSVSAQLGLLGACAIAFPTCWRISLGGVRAAGRRPGLSRVLGRVGHVLLALFALCLTAALALLFRYWSTFRYLPWYTLNMSALALALSWLWRSGVRRFSTLRVAERGLFWVLLPLALLRAFLPYLQSERSEPVAQTLIVGQLGQRALLLAFDFDGDGYLPRFAGGADCKPYDRAVNPAAVDVPNNGRDEDCDGVDLDAGRLKNEARRDFAPPAAFPQRPTIVLITIDTFAARRMRALGGTRNVTPQLDAFAQQAVSFSAAFSQGPSTRLAFPALFTSRWDSQITIKLEGIHPYPIADSELLLAQVVHDAGYATAAVLPDPYFVPHHWHGLTRGFDVIDESPLRHTGFHNSAQVTDAALAQLTAARDKPLFLWVHYYDAHAPHHQPVDGKHFGSSSEDTYDAELALVDSEVGRLLRGVDARSLVVVTADHGIGFDAPRHVKFNYGYELSSVVLQVPLLVRAPTLTAHRVDTLASTMDIAPTLTNLLRLPRPARFEGASLVAELLDQPSPRPQRLLHEFYLPERLWDDHDPLDAISLRTERYHLVHDRTEARFELYDWVADFEERNDLVDSREHAAALLALKQQLALFTFRVYDRAHVAAIRSSTATPPR